MPSKEEAFQLIFSIVDAWMEEFDHETPEHEERNNHVHQCMHVIMDALEITSVSGLPEYYSGPEPEPTFDNNTNMEI